MIKRGYTSIDDVRTYSEYICEHCGKYLGAIETIYDGKHIEERDDIVGWIYCPYCGEPLWE